MPEAGLEHLLGLGEGGELAIFLVCSGVGYDFEFENFFVDFGWEMGLGEFFFLRIFFIH